MYYKISYYRFESSNTITFELRDNGGVVIDDTTLNICWYTKS